MPNNPLFNMLGGGAPMGGNNPQFMQMINHLQQFRKTIQGNPQQMVMDAVKSGRVNQQQLNMAQNMATQIQQTMRSMGL